MLGRTDAENLIVDVRHNNGGNNGLLAPLVRTMVWWEQDAPDRRIFVITGRNTFSAAQNFINRVERWTDAIFVGEPSSSRPNFSGEETNLVLPFTRVRGSISTMYWQDSDPGDVRRWIAPQVPVEIADLRVCELAVQISEAQLREIFEMEWLIDDIEQNGLATTSAEAEARPVPDFEVRAERQCGAG